MAFELKDTAKIKTDGNAGTASKLETAHSIAISGGAIGTATLFDGSSDITIPVTSLDSSKLSGTVSVAHGGTGATTAANALTNLGLTATATELNYVDGVTSAIQTQLNNKEPVITKNSAFNKNFGTSAGTVCEGNDSRLTDARTPTAHVSTHKTGGTDALAPADIGAEPAFTKNSAFNKNFEGTASNIKVAGTAAVGSLSTVARADHVHPAQTTVSGNAGSATKLATARTIGISGGATGTATSFNGSANITIPVTALDESKLSSAVSIERGGTGATTASEALSNLGLTATAEELNYVDGVTSAIQTQIDGKENSFSKNTAFNKDFGTASGTVCEGNDSRLSDSRTPTAHASTATTYGASSASNYGHAMASSTTPKAAGTAAIGTETAKFARGDHVHPAQTTVSGNAGSATKLATARTIGISGGATGTATSFDGSANITIPVTSLDASKLSGLVPISSIPPSALERLVVVADDTARFALTTDDVQLGDTVKVTSTNKMYFVIDVSKLSSEDGYSVYTAGAASSVPWSGVTGKPSSFTPSAHASTHASGGSDAITPTSIGAEPAFTKNNAFNKSFGTASGTVCQGNDSRLSNARTPTAHASTHASGGTDVITPADIGAEPAFTKNSAFNKNFEGTASNIKVAGTAAVGSLSTVARADHVHPAQTTVSGNAGSATKLATARTIGISGGATGTATSFNGTANITIPVTALDESKLSSAVAIARGGTGATTAEDALVNLGLTATATELNYVDGVTSAIQTQIDGKEPAFTKNGAFNKNFGTASGTVCEGNDSRLSNSRTPTAHASTSTTYGASSASNYGHAMASSTTPIVAGTAAVGSETSKFARGDHVHPAQTSVSGSSGSCTGNAATATKLATARAIDGVSFDGTAAITHYGACSTAAGTAAKTVDCTSYTLVTGSRIIVKFSNTNSASNPTLNVNSTGAKAIYYKGAAITASYLKANYAYEFVYDGTNYVLVGEIDTNTTYTLSSITGTLAIAKGGTGATTAADALTNLGLTATATELNYCDGVTSAIQTQLDGKEPAFTKNSAFNKNFEGTASNIKVAGTAAVGSLSTVARADHVHPAQTSVSGNAGTATTLKTARTIGISGGATGTATSFNGSANITIPVTALDESKLSSAVAIARGGTGATTAEDALVNLGLTATATELNYVDGVTSAIQTQLDGKEPAFTKNSAFNKNFGTESGTVCQGNDSRLSNSRTPTAHASTATTYGASSDTNYGHAMASSTTPKAAGTAAVGSETAKFARGDHVHPAQTTVSGNAGTATKLATARTIGISGGATGTATSFNGSTNITIPVTALDASKLSGFVPVECIPPAALERLVVVADDTARFALTTDDVQLGDTVKVTSTNKMYFVIDVSKLSSEDGYSVYTAGAASSVPWSGVTGKPSSFTPSAHVSTHKTGGTDALAPADIGAEPAFTKNSAFNKNFEGTASNIKVAGTAAVGSLSTVARADHVHPAQTSVSGSSGSCTGNAATATKLATARAIDGVSFDGTAAITHYGACSTAAATAEKAVACTSYTLVTGSRIIVKFSTTNSASNPTLNVNSTGAKAIYYKGAAITASYLKANYAYEFVYDGTNYVLVGEIDTNTTYTLSSITGTLAIAKGGTGATTAADALTNLGLTATATELNYCDGVTSAIQTQLNGKEASFTKNTAFNKNFETTASNYKVAGTAAVGSLSTVARADHIHPAQTSVSGSSGSCTGNAATATKLATARTIDGVSFDGTAAITHYGTCSTAAGTAAKTVACTSYTLVTGSMILVKFTVANTAANPTLNVNSTGAKAMYYNGSAVSTTMLQANNVYPFVYDGTNYLLIGNYGWGN